MGKNSDRERKAIERKDRKEKEKVGEMSFLDHLEELRWHIIRSLIAVFVLAVFAFIIQDFIFQELIFKPKSPDFWTNRMFAKMAEFFNTDALRINQKEIELINIKLPGQFNMSMWTAMIAGLIMAAPVVFWEFWKFIKPALYENEKGGHRSRLLHHLSFHSGPALRILPDRSPVDSVFRQLFHQP